MTEPAMAAVLDEVVGAVVFWTVWVVNLVTLKKKKTNYILLQDVKELKTCNLRNPLSFSTYVPCRRPLAAFICAYEEKLKYISSTCIYIYIDLYTKKTYNTDVYVSNNRLNLYIFFFSCARVLSIADMFVIYVLSLYKSF